MDKKQPEEESSARLQPLYGVFDRAIASNDAAKMKAAAEELRKRKSENPDIESHLAKLEAAIAKLSAEK